MPVTTDWLMRSKLLQPGFIVMVKSALVIVYEDRSRDVHGINQTKTLADPALTDEFLDPRGDVDEPPPRLHFKPQMFGKRLQCLNLQPGKSLGATRISRVSGGAI